MVYPAIAASELLRWRSGALFRGRIRLRSRSVNNPLLRMYKNNAYVYTNCQYLAGAALAWGGGDFVKQVLLKL